MRRKMLLPHLITAKDARAARTREALRLGMLKMLDVKPLDQITIRDICDVSDVGYTTFFRYHSTKESLLNDVAAEQMGQLVGLSNSVGETSDLKAGSIALCTYVNEHRHLWTTLLTGGAAGVMRDEFIRLSRQIEQTETRRVAWPPPDIATILVVSSTIELLTWWLRDNPSYTVEQVAEILELAIISPTVNNQKSPRP